MAGTTIQPQPTPQKPPDIMPTSPISGPAIHSSWFIGAPPTLRR